jgi:hypothetical protein
MTDQEQTALALPASKGRRISPPSPKMTTQQLDEALHAHFIRPEDRRNLVGAGAVYLTEVTAPDGSGRRADAVHVGLWSSRGGGRIDVCELKVSRSDFRRELEEPRKAEAWWPYSTTFSIVSPGIDITPPEELPPGWGLLIPNPRPRSRRFKTIVAPEEREPKLTIGLLLTLLKNTETTRTNALAAQARDLRNQHAQDMQKLRSEKVVLDHPRVQARLSLLNQIEAAMGLEVDDFAWDGQISPQAAGEGLALFMQGHQARQRAREAAQRQAEQLERVAQQTHQEAQRLRESFTVTDIETRKAAQ